MEMFTPITESRPTKTGKLLLREECCKYTNMKVDYYYSIRTNIVCVYWSTQLYLLVEYKVFST